jgi:alkyl hydroperoxide reductase subunit AhpF
MALLRDEDVTQLRELFERELSGDVTLVHFTQKPSKLVVPGAIPCPSCQDTAALLEELAATSEHIGLETHDFVADASAADAHGVDKIPATIVTGVGALGRVRIFGLPSGYEFGTLVEDIIDVGSARHGLGEASLEAVRDLHDDVHIQVFVTPT